RVALANGDALSGSFAISGDSSTGYLNVAGTAIAARLGDPARGPSLSLTDGSLVMRLGREGHDLRATGTGAFQGLPGSSFSGTLGFLSNTLDGAERVQRCEAVNAHLDIAGLGSLDGDFAFSAWDGQTDTANVNELRIGARNVHGAITMGDLQLQADRGWLAVVLATETPLEGMGAAVNSIALTGEMDLRVAVDGALTLTGEKIRLSMNPGSQKLVREIVTTGEVILLDLAPETMRVSGAFTATIQGVITFSGDLDLDLRKSARMLSNGQSVRLWEYGLSGSRVTARLGAANGMEVTVAGAEMALVYAREDGGPRSWLTTRGTTSFMTVAGQRFDGLESAGWSLNRAVDAVSLAEKSTIDWSATRSFTLKNGRAFLLDQVGEVFTLPVQGSMDLGNASLAGDLLLTYDRSANFWEIKAREAEALLAVGMASARIAKGSGTLRVNGDKSRSGSIAGQFQLSGIAGLSLAGDGSAGFNQDGTLSLQGTATATVDGFGAITGNFSFTRENGAAGPRILVGASNVSATVGDATAGVDISGASLGMILVDGGYALVAEGNAALRGFDGTLSLAASGRVAINHLGTTLDETLNLSSGGSVLLKFDDPRPGEAVVIDSGTVSVAGLGSLSGALRIESRRETVAGVTRQKLAIGCDNLEGNVTLGGATAVLSGGRGGLLLFKEGTTSRYAVQAEGSVTLTGIDAVSLSAQRMELACNRMEDALETTVATAGGWFGMNLLKNETRLRGYASAEVAGMLAVDGALFIESQTDQTVTLVGGATVTVDNLVVGGAGLSAALQATGIGLTLADTDLALVLSSEKNGSRRWLTTSGLVGSLATEGIDLAETRLALLDINRELTANGAVIDWSQSPRAIALSDTKVLPVTASDARFTTMVDGVLRLGGATLSGAFEIRRGADGGSWEITATAVQVAFEANGAQAAIENASGTLVLAPSGNSGSLIGTGSVTGVDGLTLTGTLAATFDNNRLELDGDVTLGVDGLGELSGKWSFVKEAATRSVPVEGLAPVTAGGDGAVVEDLRGGGTSNTVLTLTMEDASGRFTREGVYGLRLDGQSFTASSVDGADALPVGDAVFAARLQSALERFSAIGVGNVLVTGSRSGGFAI
ncbi:MAG: hypothetical protein HQK87_10105, partial [Nitrospinae bacterium]|nr:hypothetical protein [Nitrospinota bacterium]